MREVRFIHPLGNATQGKRTHGEFIEKAFQKHARSARNGNVLSAERSPFTRP